MQNECRVFTKFVQIKRRKLVKIRSSGICLCGKRCKSKCAHLTTFIDRTFVIESTNRICIYWILPCHHTIIAATGNPMLATLPKKHNIEKGALALTFFQWYHWNQRYQKRVSGVADIHIWAFFPKVLPIFGLCTQTGKGTVCCLQCYTNKWIVFLSLSSIEQYVRII